MANEKPSKRAGRAKPNDWRVTVNVRGELHLALRELCEVRGLKIQHVVDTALAQAIARMKDTTL